MAIETPLPPPDALPAHNDTGNANGTNGTNGVHMLPPLPPAPPPPPTPPDPDAWKKLLDRKENGSVDSTLHNAAVYLEHCPDDFKGMIVWNDYNKKLEVRGGALKQFDSLSPKAIITGTQDYLAHTYGIVVKSRTDIAERIMMVALKNRYNPLLDHLNAIVWDCVPRIDNIFLTYFGAGKFADPNHPTKEELDRVAHLRRIGRRWLLGAIERAFAPGCKVDNSVILEGLQGQKKTTALEALFGRFYSSTAITVGDKDSKMIAAKNWAVDLPDSDFLTKKHNKGFLTTRKDTFRPPYGDAIEETPRTCFFVGSVNPDPNDTGYDDETGARRPWPVLCGKIDRAGLLRDSDKILAEAVAIRKASLTCPACLASDDTVFDQKPRCVAHRWWLDPEEEAAAAVEIQEREQEVPYKLRIHEWWLDLEPSKRPTSFSVEDVAGMALGIAEERLTERLQGQIGVAVRKLGFRKTRPTINGVRHYAYAPSPKLATDTRTAKPNRTLYALTGGKTPSTKP